MFSDASIDAAFHEEIAPSFADEADDSVLVDLPALFAGADVLLWARSGANHRPQRQHHPGSPWRGETRTYDCRHIEQYRWAPAIPRSSAAVGALLDREPLRGQCTLAIDHTGVGRPVFDMFVEARLQPIGITITGGVELASGNPRFNGTWRRSCWWAWCNGSCSRGACALGPPTARRTLQKELRDFRVKISKAANETYEAREGAHDDIVLSLALSLFIAEHPLPRFRPLGE